MSLAKYGKKVVSFVQQNWQASAMVAVLLLIILVLRQPATSESGAGQPGAADTETDRTEIRSNLELVSRRNDLQPAIAWQEAEASSQAGSEQITLGFTAQERDPFELDREQESPPILFEEDLHTDESGVDGPMDGSQVASDSTLLLMSTFLSDTRRAAYINQQLYFEGMQIRDGSDWWQIQRIEPRQVILAHGKDRHTLKIKQASAHLPTTAVEERISSDYSRDKTVR